MRSESVSDVSWEKYFSAAKRYYAVHNDLKTPAAFVDENGIDLDRWIAQIRVFRKSGIRSKLLSEERVAELDHIGMIWDVPDYIWEENYAAAVRYHKKFGNLNVPHDYVYEEDIKLGLWLGKMRTNRRTSSINIRDLTDEQIARLDGLGIIWQTKHEKQWNDAFQALCVHIETNGSFDILVSFVTDSGSALGKWIRRQRDFFEQGRLSDERIEKLRGIGFVLEKIDPWEEKYQLDKDYFEKHGDLNIPGQYVVNGVWLSKWVNEQKLIAEGKRKKQLTPEQLSKLEAIGLRYGAAYYEELWNERFEMAKAYYDEHGDLDVPQK